MMTDQLKSRGWYRCRGDISEHTSRYRAEQISTHFWVYQVFGNGFGVPHLATSEDFHEAFEKLESTEGFADD